MNLSLVTIIILAVIIVIQELQIKKLYTQVNVLFGICEALNKLNDKHVEAAQHVVELIKIQDSALRALHDAISEASESKCEDE